MYKRQPQGGLAVDSFTLSSGAVYGAAAVKTDQTGTAYLWLPDNGAGTGARSGIYVFTGEVKSGASADLTSGTVLFDLAKGPVVLGETYSGTDAAGPVSYTHLKCKAVSSSAGLRGLTEPVYTVYAAPPSFR